MQGETCVTELDVETLAEGVVRRFAWLDKPQARGRFLGPVAHGVTGVFGAGIKDDYFGQTNVPSLGGDAERPTNVAGSYSP